MTNLRRHAFLTKRGLEYREAGAWRIDGFILENVRECDATLANLWSENRAIWILDENWATTLDRVLVGARRFELKTNRFYDLGDGGEEAEAPYTNMSLRVAFKPKGAPDSVKDCLILFPDKALQWEMDEESDPEVCEWALARLQEHFSRSLVYPPGRLSTYLMESTRERAKEQWDYKRPPSTFDPWLRLSQGDDPLDDWKRLRPFTHTEKKTKYIHAFDKNAAYLQAIGIPLGVGEYHRYDAKERLLDWERPGVWKVKTRPYFSDELAATLLDGGRQVSRMFNPPGLRGSEPFSVWVATPQFKLMCELDLITDVEEAYLADDSSKLFATYYSHIKQALSLADELIANNLDRPDGSEIVERRKSGEIGKRMKSFAKAIYSRGIGYLRAEFARESGQWFYRPDWWAMIVAEVGARLFRDTREVWKESGDWPVGVYVDCVYYASDEPDWRKAFPVFSESGRFGNKFKHKGTCANTKKLAGAFGNGMSPGEFGGVFKRAASEFEEVDL